MLDFGHSTWWPTALRKAGIGWTAKADLVSTSFLEAVASVAGFVDVDGELRVLGTRASDEGELVDEVIETRAKIMDHISDQYSKTRYNGRSDMGIGLDISAI